MITAEEWRLLRREIRTVMRNVLAGKTKGTQVDGVVGTEGIEELVPGHPTFSGRPVAHPYGFVSRAVDGTVQVTAKIGDSPEARIILLHRDADRPALDASGEVMLYDANGNQIHLKDGAVVVTSDKIKLGSDDASDPVALAPKSKDEMDKITTWMTAIDAVWQAVIPEAGMGAPSALGTALKAASAAAGGVPTIQSPASSKVVAE